MRHKSILAATDYLNMIGKPLNGPTNQISGVDLHLAFAHRKAARIASITKANCKK